jgi:hypothetical protein
LLEGSNNDTHESKDHISKMEVYHNNTNTNWKLIVNVWIKTYMWRHGAGWYDHNTKNKLTRVSSCNTFTEIDNLPTNITYMSFSSRKSYEIGRIWNSHAVSLKSEVKYIKIGSRIIFFFFYRFWPPYILKIARVCRHITAIKLHRDQ